MAFAPPSAPGPAPHIVDVLIAERAPRLAAGPLWPAAKTVLYPLLAYRQARAMADALAALSGREALDHLSALLDLRVETRRAERIPRDGRVIVVVNHPTGLADGVAVYDALKAARPDLVFYANADAQRVNPRFDEVLIPVEWVLAKRTLSRSRVTLQRTYDAMAAERALVVFPSGRLSRRGAGGVLADPPWAPGAVALARRCGAPILPIHLDGPASSLFHLFNRVSSELRDITLFHEMLNKRGGRFALTVGPLIAPDALVGDPAETSARLKAYVEQILPQDLDQAFA